MADAQTRLRCGRYRAAFLFDFFHAELTILRGETPAQAAVRKVWEESGLRELTLIQELGVTLWQDEEQHFYLFQTGQALPDRFEHVVTGRDGDRGMRYQYRWIEITPALSPSLVQGSNAFVGVMMTALE